MRKSENPEIVRWGAVDRLTHWLLIIGVSFAVLTSLPSFDTRLFGWLSLPNVLARNLHLASGMLLMAAALIHIVYRIVKPRKTRIFPSGKDFSDFGQIVRHWFDKSKPYPKLGFHHPVEKLDYWGLAVIGLLLTGVGGIMLWFPGTFPPSYATWAIVLTGIGFFIMATILVGHIIFALLPVNRPALKAMLLGRKVSAEWAKENHPAWAEELLGTSNPGSKKGKSR
ncbi:MAG: cytochrome b/b6 domain-containing protein [Candidatus Bathyarchaeia archaeon]